MLCGLSDRAGQDDRRLERVRARRRHSAHDGGRYEGHGALEAGSIDLQRGRAAWRRHGNVRTDCGHRTGRRRHRISVAYRVPEHGNLRALWGGEPAIVARIDDAGEAGYDVFVDRAKAAAFVSAIGAAGAVPLDLPTAEAIRLEAGVPRFHRDMDEETIPLEAGIESRAISFTKRCYVGQEVVIRVLHRGHGRVVRKLVGLLVDGNQTPAPGAGVRGADRDIGRVTSSAFSPALQRPIALAYVHRDFVATGTMVTVDGANAEVTSLPFVSR
ncbi:MAG: hypothetical protein DMF97_09145 [Acidobacteria bacterium]|nr:MAG: hypothetical protein DMF97_09145 [Acidobacteriota bacterium]